MSFVHGAARVFIVVPAWDEAPRIARVLRTMPPWAHRIFVVDDASTDRTVAEAEGVGDRRVEVLRHRVNAGVGAAIVTGYRRALAVAGSPDDAFVVMAGDGQMDPRDLPAIVEPVVRGAADYVKGTRLRDRASAARMPPARRWAGVAFSWATSLAIGTRISDSQCGYTSISRGACARLDLGRLWPRYGYPNDLLGMLSEQRLRIVEVPVRAVYADEVSRLKPRHVPVVAALVARTGVRRLRRSWALRG